MRISLNAADRLSLTFLALLSILAVLFIPALPSLQRLLGAYFILAAGLIAIAGYRQSGRAGNDGFYLHVLFTVAMILMIFNSLGELIPAVRQRTYDDLLIRIDHALFGVHPTVWMERFINPFLTAVLQLAYISYYLMPVALGITLAARGRRAEFQEALFGIVLCFYLSYIGYLLVPAVGPRFTLLEMQTTDLQAGPFVNSVQETLNRLEHNKTDAFPSGHTAIALVTLYYARKRGEKLLFRILFPATAALILSTVYLRYHYVIDVFAGILLAVFTLLLAPKLRVRLSGAYAQPGNERHDGA